DGYWRALTAKTPALVPPSQPAAVQRARNLVGGTAAVATEATEVASGDPRLARPVRASHVGPVRPVRHPLVHVPHHVEHAPARLAAAALTRGHRIRRIAGALGRPFVRSGVGRARRRPLPLAVRQQPFARDQTRLVRLEPGDAGARLYARDRDGVDPRRRRLRSRDRRPVAGLREGDPVIDGGFGRHDVPTDAGRRELLGPASGEIGQRRLSVLYLLHELRVRGVDLPHTRLVRVDADVPDLHRVGRALECPGPDWHGQGEADGDETNDAVHATLLHGITCP